MDNPCRWCTDRVLGCHGKCRDYMAYVAANEQTKANKQDHYNKNGILVESIRRHNERNRNPNRTHKTNKAR